MRGRRLVARAGPLAFAALLLLHSEGGSAASVLPRIVSMNVCTDQLLLSLADPAEIAGLSRYARDAAQSYGAEQAERFPILSGGAEQVLMIHPDIVLAGQFDHRATRELLQAHGLDIEEFAVPRDLDEVKQQIRRIGEIAGHADRAAAEIAALDAAMARARRAVAAKHYAVLPLSRRGWVAGRDSLVSSLLTATGLFSAAAELGVTDGGFVTLEEIIRARPDFLLLSEAGDQAEDEGRAFLLHPALEHFYPPQKRMVIPERLTVCGGVMLSEALDLLVRELQRVAR